MILFLISLPVGGSWNLLLKHGKIMLKRVSWVIKKNAYHFILAGHCLFDADKSAELDTIPENESQNSEST